MRKTIPTLFLAASMLLGPVTSFAGGFVSQNAGQVICVQGCDINPVPEINAAGIGLAIALLGGIVALVRERRNRLK